MEQVEAIANLLWKTSMLRAEIIVLRRSGRLATKAFAALTGTEYSVESVGADLVNAMAAQQLADHLNAETLHVAETSS